MVLNILDRVRWGIVTFIIGALFLSMGARAYGQATQNLGALPGGNEMIVRESPSTAATPEPEGPLFEIGDEIFTIDRDMTLYYRYQESTDGSHLAKRELRYGRNLWNKNAQIRIRIPEWTSYPNSGPAFSGLGSIELGYSYSVSNPTFDHYLEGRVALPTVGYGVQSNDTELKAFYGPKWKWRGGSASFVSEYDQTIIKPPGSSWTSYYDGTLTVPSVPIFPGVKLAAIYEGRFVFSSGGIYKSVAGGTLFGSIKNVALSVIDTWGIGANGLWRYRFEANATARF